MLKTTFPLGLHYKTIPSICRCSISLTPNACLALLLHSAKYQPPPATTMGIEGKGAAVFNAISLPLCLFL